MSGVVYLPPRPKKRPIRKLLARLRSVLALRREPAPVGAIRTSAASAGGLRIRSRRARTHLIFELSGELSARTRDPLALALEEALEDDSERIVLDLTELASIDHAGLDTILAAHLFASDELKTLVIVPGPPPVQRVFDAVEGPFCFAPPRGNRGGATRSRGRRSGLSAPVGGQRTGNRSGRRSG